MTTYGPELLVNPGAEASLAATSAWGSGVTTARDTNEAHSGTASIRVVTPGSIPREGVYYRTNVGLSLTGETRRYRALAWAKGTGTVMVMAEVRYTTGSATEAVGDAVPIGDAWTEVPSVVVTADPTRTIDHIRCYVMTDTTQGITFYSDDASMREVIPSDAPRPSRVFVLGSKYNLGPMKVGRR